MATETTITDAHITTTALPAPSYDYAANLEFLDASGSHTADGFTWNTRTLAIDAAVGYALDDKLCKVTSREWFVREVSAGWVVGCRENGGEWVI